MLKGWQQSILLLSLGKFLHVFYKLFSVQIQAAQHGKEHWLINFLLFGKFFQCSGQMRGILVDIGNDKIEAIEQVPVAIIFSPERFSHPDIVIFRFSIPPLEEFCRFCVRIYLIRLDFPQPFFPFRKTRSACFSSKFNPVITCSFHPDILRKNPCIRSAVLCNGKAA